MDEIDSITKEALDTLIRDGILEGVGRTSTERCSTASRSLAASTAKSSSRRRRRRRSRTKWAAIRAAAGRQVRAAAGVSDQEHRPESQSSFHGTSTERRGPCSYSAGLAQVGDDPGRVRRLPQHHGSHAALVASALGAHVAAWNGGGSRDLRPGHRTVSRSDCGPRLQPGRGCCDTAATA